MKTLQLPFLFMAAALTSVSTPVPAQRRTPPQSPAPSLVIPLPFTVKYEGVRIAFDVAAAPQSGDVYLIPQERAQLTVTGQNQETSTAMADCDSLKGLASAYVHIIALGGRHAALSPGGITLDIEQAKTSLKEITNGQNALKCKVEIA